MKTLKEKQKKLVVFIIFNLIINIDRKHKTALPLLLVVIMSTGEKYMKKKLIEEQSKMFYRITLIKVG